MSAFDQRDQHVGTQHNTYIAAPSPPPPPRRFAAVPPASPTPLVGRDALLSDLITGLTAGQARALSTDGQGGAGKTALALAVAYHPAITAHFTGGVLWASLGPTGSPTNALTDWATALGLELTHLPTLDQRRDRLVQALDDRPVLVILDDVWDLAAANALRLHGPNVTHLLTTRGIGVARAFAGEVNRRHVAELAPDPALALLQQLAPHACAADPDHARQLVAATGGLPLALVLLGGYLASPASRHFMAQRQAAWQRAADPATRLALACTRLGTDAGAEVALSDVVTLSLHDLAEPVHATFYALGAFAPKPATFDLTAAQTVTGADPDVLGVLIDRNLLEIDVAERLAVHQVVADAARHATPPAALAAHDAYYLGVVNADREDWQRIEGVYDQVQQALARLGQDDTRLIPWALALFTYWFRRGLSAEGLRWTAAALAVAETGGELATQGKLCNNLGEYYYARSEYPPAMAVYRRALDLFRQAGDVQCEAEALHNIGNTVAGLGGEQQALDYYNQALPLLRQTGDVAGEARTLNSIGHLYNALGDRQQALDYYNQALPLRRQVGDKYGEAYTLHELGVVYDTLGDKQQALDYFNQTLPLRRQVGDKAGEAYTLSYIGYVYSALGDRQQALDYVNQTLPLQRQLGDKSGEATTLSYIGYVYDALGDRQQALDYYDLALALQRQVGDKADERVTRWNIAMICGLDLSDLDRAVAELEQVVALDEAIHHPKLERDRAELARMRARRDAG